MADNISNYAESKILNHTLGVSSYAFVSTIYLALYTSNPTDADTGTEVSTSSTGYARQTITFGTSSAGSAVSNSGTVTFGPATVDWGTISHVGIRDASSAGNLIWYGALTQSKVVQTGDTFQITSGSLTVSVA